MGVDGVFVVGVGMEIKERGLDSRVLKGTEPHVEDRTQEIRRGAPYENINGKMGSAK